MSIVEIAAQLRGVLNDIIRQRAGISSMIESLTRTIERYREVTAGSGDRLAVEAVAAYVAAAERLREADRHLVASAGAIVEYGRVIGINLGVGDLSPVQHSQPRRPPPPRASVPSPAIQQDGRSLPVRAGPRDRTSGVFNGELIVSGEDAGSVADLRPFPGGGWPDAVIGHVESHVAARMRRQGLTEGDVVLNNVTCGNRGFDNDWPATCEKNIRPILPAGARLTVWATQDGGDSWWTKTYVGTGERIES